MNNPPPVQFAAESSRQRLLRVLQPEYLLALLRSRWRSVLVVMTLGTVLGLYCALKSPTYQARVRVYVEGMNDQGVVTNDFSLSLVPAHWY